MIQGEGVFAPTGVRSSQQVDGTVLCDRSTVGLLMPVLNEIEGMRATLPFLDRSLFDDILIVDGGSTDGSIEYAKEQGIRVMHQRRPGLAHGVFDAAMELATEYVVQLSPDGNCPISYLPALVEALQDGYDLVVVSRYLPPAVSEDDTWVTAFGNWFFTKLTSFLGGTRITDSLTCYRGYRRNILYSHDFSHYLRGPVLEPLISALCCLYGLRVHEIPGDEPKRLGGASKMRPLYNGSCILYMLMRLYLKKLLGR